MVDFCFKKVACSPMKLIEHYIVCFILFNIFIYYTISFSTLTKQHCVKKLTAIICTKNIYSPDISPVTIPDRFS